MPHKILTLPTLSLLLLPTVAFDGTARVQQSKGGEAPTANAPPLAAEQQPLGKGGAREPGDQNIYKVSIVPAPTKDHWDKASTLINGLLALVGAIGIGFAYSTLRKIERQTTATETSSKIAERSLALLISEKRARLSLDLNPSDAGINDDFWDVTLRITNQGLSRAFNITFLLRYCVTKTEDRPIGQMESPQTAPKVLKPDEEWDSDPILPVPTNLGVSDVADQTAFAHIYGALMYRDVFCEGAEARTVSFHYVWHYLATEDYTVNDDGEDDWVGRDYSQWTRVEYTST